MYLQVEAARGIIYLRESSAKIYPGVIEGDERLTKIVSV